MLLNRKSPNAGTGLQVKKRRHLSALKTTAYLIAGMRPRSRLLAKKRLPTIREGYEELLQDMNQVNSYHAAPCHAQRDGLSTEDYLLSICQLARPAFPLREQDRDILTLGQLEALKPGLRLPRLPTPTRPLTPTARSCSYREEEKTEKAGSRALHGGNGSRADPLEYLYGRRDTPASSTCVYMDTEGRLSEDPEKGGASPGSRPRSQSFPRLCSPRHAHRKSSCPEIRLADTPSPAPLGNRPCPSNGKKPSATTLPSESDQEMMGWCSPAGERKNCNGGADKHSVISSWIADCRTAWHEAKMKACMLPTIAEI
ncbi:hypothetical protein SKAU_G00365200 [Synaphobranchus kaupii]|uniref:Uncharacterized protein n=1 Tax=Synaphobranchus kaupii TaxID=118154 RepID=A0A9Q1EEY8_SYNKA|nr:hypothetical protein SKAU_G00365200 [Synaphobranchus kaupii]